jgi:hypothetical protein
MAADLVGRKVDVIFVSGVAVVLAAKTRDLNDPDHFLLLVTRSRYLAAPTECLHQSAETLLVGAVL